MPRCESYTAKFMDFMERSFLSLPCLFQAFLFFFRNFYLEIICQMGTLLIVILLLSLGPDNYRGVVIMSFCLSICAKVITPEQFHAKITKFWKHKHLTHWGRVTHIWVSELTIIGSDNGLSPSRRQAIICTNAGILLIRPLGTNFNEILIEIHIISFKKIHLKMSSGKWRTFCLGLNVLTMIVNWIKGV